MIFIISSYTQKHIMFTYGDLLEFMDFEYARKNGSINLATLANMAMAPAPPSKVYVDVSGLSNST